MWILAAWFVVGLIIAMVFGLAAQRTRDPIDREITTQVGSGQRNTLSR